jgi:hypothetical protein
MPRQSKQEELTRALHAYLSIAEMHTPEEYPLGCRGVAKALSVSPTTLYKYRLQEPIRAAEQRQRERGNLVGKNPRLKSSREHIQKLQEEVKQAEARNKHLVARIALVEANAARLGIDPEELYRPVMKPARTVSHAGQHGTKRTSYLSKRR